MRGPCYTRMGIWGLDGEHDGDMTIDVSERGQRAIAGSMDAPNDWGAVSTWAGISQP